MAYFIKIFLYVRRPDPKKARIKFYVPDRFLDEKEVLEKFQNFYKIEKNYEKSKKIAESFLNKLSYQFEHEIIDFVDKFKEKERREKPDFEYQE